MDTLHDSDLGDIWAAHYPRRDDDASRMLLETLIGVILQRDEFRTAHQDFGDTLHEVLEKLGIQRQEFYEFEKELDATRNDAQD